MNRRKKNYDVILCEYSEKCEVVFMCVLMEISKDSFSSFSLYFSCLNDKECLNINQLIIQLYPLLLIWSK